MVYTVYSLGLSTGWKVDVGLATLETGCEAVVVSPGVVNVLVI